MSAQQPLDFTPEPVPVVRIKDASALIREERPRLQRQCLLILGRLQEGQATGAELEAVAHCRRLGARLYEIRKAGHDIRIVENDHVTGRVVYRLFMPERVAPPASAVMATITHRLGEDEAY